MSFDATIGTPTKVEIASSETVDGVTTHKLNWSVGDKIRVYSDNSSGVDGVEFTTDISEPSATASFEGTIDAADAYYAFYPSSAKATWNYINRCFCDTNIHLAGLADRVYLNPDYLGRIFKKETGFGFSEYLTLVRIKSAERLLAEGKKNVTDIAFECGFNDSSYFASKFKELIGITPKKYQKEN